MDVEKKLKQFILSRYKSIREFTQVVDISYSTMDSILRRGIGNSSVNNIIKICRTLNISMDKLANGEIEPLDYSIPVTGSYTDIEDIMREVRFRLTTADELTLNSKPLSSDNIESIITAAEISVEMVKRKNAYQTV